MAHDGDLLVRFIEYMPFNGSKFWDADRLVSGADIVKQVRERYELVPLERGHGDTASHFRFAEGSTGEIGMITSMTKPFCSDCDRIRLKADGKSCRASLASMSTTSNRYCGAGQRMRR